jgi:glycosyltransferase involved in cell wall biosynthesis
MAPLVTVLTTTYNHSKYIGNCIRSVQAQTFTDWEQVIVDDGSTDNTGEIAAGFSDNRIQYIRQEHVGIHRLSETYNRGLKLAKGKYIAILEGDDLWPRRKLEFQTNSLSDGTVLSFGKYIIINQDKKYLGVYPKNGRAFAGVTDWLKPLIVYDYIPSLTTMIQKEALLKVGGFLQPPGAAYVDYATFLELSLLGKFKYVDEVLGIWVKHGDNFSDAFLFTNITDKYSVEFCRKHGIPIDWQALERQKGRDLFHIARHQLMNGEKDKAMNSFKESFRNSSMLGKFKSLGGMAAAAVGLDLEETARLLRRPTEK